jgi:hypothetical protein
MPQPNGEWVRNAQRKGMEYFLKVRFHGLWIWDIYVENKEDGHYDVVNAEYNTDAGASVYVCQALHNEDEALEKFLIS